jgi:peptide/nickel transport system permease protein
MAIWRGAVVLLSPARRAGRLAGIVGLTIFGLLFVTFLIGRVLPVDPVLAAAGDRVSGVAYEEARHALGLDQPLYRQFVVYVGHALSGDLGRSVLTANPVREDIAHVFPATLELATAATLIGLGAGVPLGVYAASRQGRWPDLVIRIGSLFGYSAPIFWLGLVGLLLFYARLGWIPSPGRLDVGYDDIVTPVTGMLLLDSLLEAEGAVFWNALRHLLLPAALLGYFSFAYICRMTRSMMIEQLRQEYIVTARIKGIAERRVLWRHAFANIRLPLVAVVALSYAGLLEGAVLTETVFAWPGIGFYITNSLLNADINAVLGATLVVGAVFIALNLASDAVYRLLDPRLR